MNINNIIRMMAVALLMTGAMACKAQKDGGGSIDADHSPLRYRLLTPYITIAR